MSSPWLQKSPVLTPAIPPRPKSGMWPAATAIAVIVFCLQLFVTTKINSHGHLQMLNRFFDADNAWYLVNFETGDQKFGSYGGRNLVHPNVANFVHPLVMLVSGAAHLISHKSNAELVEVVSLAVAPAFAGMRSGLLFAALITASFSLVDAIFGTLLCSVAFSSVLFGCLPESFVISGAWFAAYSLVSAQSASEHKLHSARWALVAMLLSSSTITNLWPFAAGLFVLLVVVVRDAKPFKTIAIVICAGLAATFLCFGVLTAAHGSFHGIGRRVGQLDEVKFSPQSMFINFPLTLARSLVADRPNQLTGTDEEHKSANIQVVRFTFREDLDLIKQAVPTIAAVQRYARNWPLEFATLAIMLTALIVSIKGLPTFMLPVKAIFLVSITQIVAHWLLHSFFGLELFLYSQHWIVPLTIALCCGTTLPGYSRWVARTAIVALIAMAAYQTTSVMRILISA